MHPLEIASVCVSLGIGTIFLALVGYKYWSSKPQTKGGILIAVLGFLLVTFGALKGFTLKGFGIETQIERLSQRIDTLRVVDLDTWITMEVNRDFVAKETGFVVVLVKASSQSEQSRHTQVDGFVAQQLVSSVAAQDGMDPRTPSINRNSMVLPVPKGNQWKISLASGLSSNVEVRWFSRASKIESAAK